MQQPEEIKNKVLKLAENNDSIRAVLQQLPDEMTLGRDEQEKKDSFTFLTIFEDGSRIDLILLPLKKFDTNFKPDSLTIVWLDKDQFFKEEQAALADRLNLRMNSDEANNSIRYIEKIRYE